MDINETILDNWDVVQETVNLVYGTVNLDKIFDTGQAKFARWRRFYIYRHLNDIDFPYTQGELITLIENWLNYVNNKTNIELDDTIGIIYEKIITAINNFNPSRVKTRTRLGQPKSIGGKLKPFLINRVPLMVKDELRKRKYHSLQEPFLDSGFQNTERYYTHNVIDEILDLTKDNMQHNIFCSLLSGAEISDISNHLGIKQYAVYDMVKDFKRIII